MSLLSLSLEIDLIIKKSKSQYQTLRTMKFFFKAFDLSKHLINNLQSTINIILDKEDDEEEVKDLSERNT